MSSEKKFSSLFYYKSRLKHKCVTRLSNTFKCKHGNNAIKKKNRQLFDNWGEPLRYRSEVNSADRHVYKSISL